MSFLALFSACFKLYSILNIYQQAHYKLKDYVFYFLRNVLFYSISLLIPLIIFRCVDILFIRIICGLFIFGFSFLFLKFKVKLRYSRRIVRLLCISITYLLCLFFVRYLNAYVLCFIEFFILPILFLDILLSKLTNKKYIINAKNKIDNYLGNKIIITGSYGKTSTKFLFEQILNIYSNTIATPKSYNTVLGISKFINDNQLNSYDNIVLEYGISHKNDMNELLGISRPDVAVVTEIGYMHMNGFRNINTVINEKMSLIKDASIAILNYENSYIRNYSVDNKIILSYGFNYGDNRALNINGGSFDYYFKDKYIISFDTNLVGEHQILNLLSIISYIHYLGYDLNKLKRVLELIYVDEKRLGVKKYDDRIILDDSFNSNFKGFCNALNVLKGYTYKRFLITPGIVELGKYKEYIYNNLKDKIIKSCDVVILVGNDLKRYVVNKGIDVYIEPSFKSAFRRYLILSNNIKSVVLIENDLPDIYIRRGIVFR